MSKKLKNFQIFAENDEKLLRINYSYYTVCAKYRKWRNFEFNVVSKSRKSKKVDLLSSIAYFLQSDDQSGRCFGVAKFIHVVFDRIKYKSILKFEKVPRNFVSLAW